MESLIIFEAGMRSPNGKYSKFIESPERSEVVEHLEIMKLCNPTDLELVMYEKTYHCVSTTPHIINIPTADKTQINAEQKALNDFVDLNMVY
jgi:hypothetical protein